MIDILGVQLTYEAIGFIGAFVAAEVIVDSKLKENYVARLVKSLIDTLRPDRKEDEKVSEVRTATDELINKLQNPGGK